MERFRKCNTYLCPNTLTFPMKDERLRKWALKSKELPYWTTFIYVSSMIESDFTKALPPREMFYTTEIKKAIPLSFCVCVRESRVPFADGDTVLEFSLGPYLGGTTPRTCHVGEKTTWVGPLLLANTPLTNRVLAHPNNWVERSTEESLLLVDRSGQMYWEQLRTGIREGLTRKPEKEFSKNLLVRKTPPFFKSYL